MAGKKIDEVEKQKRIYQVSLLLRRRPTGFIVDFIRQEWGIERALFSSSVKATSRFFLASLFNS